MASETVVAPVAIGFQARVVMASKRKPETVQLRGTASVRFRRASPSDLSPAVVMKATGSHHGLEIDKTLFAFEDGLWATAGDGKGGHGDVRPPLGEAEFLAQAAAPREGGFGNWFPNPFDMTAVNVRVDDPAFRARDDSYGSVVHNMAAMDELAVRKVLPETEAAWQAAAADAQRVADSVMFCGGQAYFRSYDPFWSVLSGIIVSDFGTEERARSWRDVRFDSSFRIDRLDHAREWYDRILIEATEGRIPYEIYGEVEVRRPDLLRRDDLKGYTQGLGPLLTQMLPMLAEAPAEKIVAWTRARDICRVLDADWTRPKAEEMLRAFASATAAVKEFHSHRDRRMAAGLGGAVAQAGAICRRAEMFDGLSFEAGVAEDDDAALSSLTPGDAA